MARKNERKIETGIWYREDKKYYRVCYSKRNPNNGNRPAKLERYGMTSITEARRVRSGLMEKVHLMVTEAIDPVWRTAVREMLLSMHEEDCGLNTIKNYEDCLKGNTVPIWGDLRVSLITSDLIRVYINETRTKWSNSHTKNMIKYINKVLNYCLDKNYISRNPLPKFKLKSNQKLKTVLNERQIKELLLKARLQNHDWYSIWATALFTGMRNGELYALKWENVSFDNNLINVCVSWNREDGYKSTKSGHDRYVEMAKPLRVIFQELKLSNHNSEFVLPRIVRWDKGEQARIVRDFLSRIGLPEIRFHDLRACWATLLLSKGVEPIKLMKIGGWSDLKTMERYVRQAGVDIKGVSSCLDDIHDPFTYTGDLIPLNRE